MPLCNSLHCLTKAVFSCNTGTSKSKQTETINLFKGGSFKVIVATTIAEEGIDVKECNLVVRYNYVGNIISQIQAKGRFPSFLLFSF